MKKHRLPAAVLALAALGFTLGTCEFVIVGILPDIAAGLNVSLAAVGRLVSVFAACYAVGTPLLTALTGRMDRFRLLMGLMLLFLGVNALSMLAPGVTVLYASRVVAALVSGTLTAVAMLYAKEVSSPEQTARAISAVYAGFSVAAVAGVPIGTAVCHALGWRATFGVILAMGQVLLMMVLGVLLMYLIMVAQFQSLLSPFIILFTIPLAFTGGFLGLWISGSDVSVIAMIGFVMLSGIIVNNGIVLVDYINQLRRSGVEKRQAIEEAGVTRLRPILMTALTTVLGLIPMVAGSSMGADMTRPMAIVTIGGLVYGTLLTLFVVPCIYDLLNRKKDMREKTVDEESMIEEAMDEKE